MLIIPFLGIAQKNKTEYLNFKLTEDKDLIWQKIYETDASLEDVLKFLKHNSFTSDLELNGSTVTGRSGKTKLSSTKGVVMAAYQSFDVFIKIDFKDNRYRVTINDLQFDPMGTSVRSGMFNVNQSNVYTLNDLAVRDKHNEIRGNSNARKLLETLDKDLNSHFIPKEIELKENW